MALTRLPSFTLLNTDSFTFANVTLTSNVTASNANLGNAVTANYFIGSAANLSSITGANVTGFVPNANVANTAYSVAAANITGTINLANYATTANSVAGANVTGAVSYATTANSVEGANVTGTVANATYATSAGTAGTVTISAQPNITSVGILASLEVSGNTVIGGNLIVNGTTTTINSTVVQIDDLAVVLANDASTSTQANGAGIIINGASANMLYINSTNSFTFSHKISADGTLLSNLTAANITGTVASATVAASANSVAGANVSGEVAYSATANAVSGANVTGFVANANVANTAYSVAAANVTGLGNIATLNLDGNSSNILYGNGSFASSPVTYGDSNVASYLPTYTGNLTLGVANLQITGGTANYVLKTDGAGNLSWTAQSGGSGTLTTVDSFTGDGANTAFTLTTTPTNANYTIAVVHGMVQPKSTYSVTGNVLTFSSAPANTAVIEITTIASADGVGGGSALTIKDEGSNISTAATSIDFVGTGVTATNVGNAVTVTVTGTSNTAIRAQAMTMGIIFGG